jgi:hypothetical protein
MSEEEPKEEKPEDCIECKVRVGTFLAISICESLKDAGDDAPDCDELTKKYEAGEMSSYDIIEVVKKYVKKDEDIETLDELLLQMGVKDVEKTEGD